MKGDYCTREGAERLKEQIARTDVRSTLVNGVPVKPTENFG